MTKLCGAQECGHPEYAHMVEPDYCRDCFDQYPSDDSTVEGGVYHHFIQ